MQPTTFIEKNWDRFCYLIFIISLKLGHIILEIIGIIAPIFGKLITKKGVIFFPYGFKGSDGANRRIMQYTKFFDHENIPTKVCHIAHDDTCHKYFNGPRWKWYFFLLFCFYKRIFQTIAATKYEAIFIQRGMFPLYFDLKHPILEKTIYKINKNVTIDYWDSVFDGQLELTINTVKYAKTITVSNPFLEQNFKQWHAQVVPWNISMVTSKYLPKINFELNHPITLVWTGLPHNLKNLNYIFPTLIKVNKKYPLKLRIIGRQAPTVEGLEIEHHFWDANTFHQLLQTADIGIYPEKNTIHANGKSAMKVMDFLSTGLAMIGVPYGLPKEAKHLKNLFIADGEMEWENALIKLIENKPLREELGAAARQTIVDNYDVHNSYIRLKNILFDNKTLN
ncbi:MAG: hypothetical protein RIQ33_2580 [Bacteroidota bacterium]|jgi:glycosyltransferase involved in cell wall biosynthesis